MLLVFLQPDLGTALVYAAAFSAVLFVAGVRWLHLALLGTLAATLVLGVLWFLPASGIEVLKPYQTARLTGFANPDADPSGLTYNVTQSITAVGSGGIDGRGVDEASQTRFDYLPEHATDFVFASFAEQRGFFGTAILLLLYLLVVWRGLRVVTVAGDLYGAVVAGGLVFGFLFQVFVNVGMTMGIAPVTGIPLPFVTVGGSSMVANLVAIGVLQGIHARGRTASCGERARDRAARRRLAGSAQPPHAVAERPDPRDRRPRRAARHASSVPAATHRSCARTAIRPRQRRSSAWSARPPRRSDEQVLRAATRALVPVIGVRTGSSGAPIPYVLATDVVDVPPGQGFPVDEIAGTLAAALGVDGAPLAGALPVLRDAVQARRVTDGVLAAGTLALGRGGPRLPVLALSQARMLSDVAATEAGPTPETPRATAEAVAPPLAAALATGVLARALVRRLPVRNRLLDGAVAAAATYALATVFGRIARR